MTFHSEKYQMVTNNEIFQLLQTKKRKSSSNLISIEENTLKYLEDTPCLGMNDRNIMSFVQSLRTYSISLSKGEILQIINSPPTTQVEVHLIVEECAQRLDPESIQNLLSLTSQHLLPVS